MHAKNCLFVLLNCILCYTCYSFWYNMYVIETLKAIQY